MKLDLFGKELLCKDIAQDDLNETTSLDTIYGGSVQLLPKRDTAGRLVYAVFVKEQREDIEDVHLHLLRRNFYMSMIVARKVENLRAGKVTIVFPSKQETLTPAAAFRATYYHALCMPIKSCGLHFCMEPKTSRWVSSAIATAATAVDRMSRARFRFHCMPQMECMYMLLTFGIPVDCLPFAGNWNNVTKDSHVAMLRQVRAQERQAAMTQDVAAVAATWQATTDLSPDDGSHLAISHSEEMTTPKFIEYPTQEDVLLSKDFPRGEPWHNFWGGNQRFRAVIEAVRDQLNTKGSVVVHMEDEETADTIVSTIIQAIHTSGGRVLQEVSNGGAFSWVQVDALEVEALIVQCLYYGIPEPDIEEHKNAYMDSRAHMSPKNQELHSDTRMSIAESCHNASQLVVPKLEPPSKFNALLGSKPPIHAKSAKAPLAGNAIMVPSNGDILLGKGKRCQNHKGNMRFRFLVDQKRPEYDAAETNEERKQINLQVLKIVKSEMKGRFLQEVRDEETRATAGWVEVDDAKARDKISMCFRSKRRTMKQEENKNNSSDAAVDYSANSSKRGADCFGGGSNPCEPCRKRPPV
ncbi:MAG: hypothetical protein SGILL_005625 [Bacillariaceae sp.]